MFKGAMFKANAETQSESLLGGWDFIVVQDVRLSHTTTTDRQPETKTNAARVTTVYHYDLVCRVSDEIDNEIVVISGDQLEGELTSGIYAYAGKAGD